MDASKQIDQYVAGLRDWRGPQLARLREWIAAAEPELEESWKWDTPVFTRGGNVVAIGAFKDHVKVNFFEGASVDDPKRLFNAGLDAKRSRGIDLHEGESIDRAAFQALVRAAAAASAKPGAPARKASPSARKPGAKRSR
jgi:hypothetical protein